MKSKSLKNLKPLLFLRGQPTNMFVFVQSAALFKSDSSEAVASPQTTFNHSNQPFPVTDQPFAQISLDVKNKESSAVFEGNLEIFELFFFLFLISFPNKHVIIHVKKLSRAEIYSAESLGEVANSGTPEKVFIKLITPHSSLWSSIFYLSFFYRYSTLMPVDSLNLKLTPFIKESAKTRFNENFCLKFYKIFVSLDGLCPYRFLLSSRFFNLILCL